MANVDWKNLSFGVVKTNCMIVSRFKDGKWTEPEATDDFHFHFNVFAGVYHYSNSCFEGLKAFTGVDGRIRVFRPEENAARMKRSGEYVGMPTPSEDLFMKMVMMCVEANKDFVPPYGYRSSLYIRPVLIGCNPQLNVETSTESTFAVMCLPVGSYTGNATLSSITAVISRNYGRVAANGTGQYKLGANYAPSFRPYNIAHSLGYKELLFPDPVYHKNIDEFGTSNFLAIKGRTYVTPLSDSVLPSITNKSLQELAADHGLKVEKRVVPVEELAEFDEVNACGTAVVITPVWKIDDKPVLEAPEISRTYTFGKEGEVGAVSKELYDHYRAIQEGTEEDIHNWCRFLD